jgi:hypothetical protein
MEKSSEYPPTMPAQTAEDRHFNEPNLAISRADRHHYVPRLYLANFVTDGRIAVYDLEDNRRFVTSPGNAAVESGFYDLQMAGRTVSTEDWLSSNIENPAAPILRRLTSSTEAMLSLSDEEENKLARYIGAQMFRVPSFRDSHNATIRHLVEQIKPMGRAFLENTLPPDKVERIWADWQTKPDEWWLGQTELAQDAEVATFMLGEVQGWANLLRAMSWRIGMVNAKLQLYTSDNPVSSHLPPVRPWWAMGALSDHAYVFPLSPEVLFRVDPIPYNEKPQPKGPRSREDFNSWETSLARHVITAGATRFLYGTTAPVSRQCALSCLRRIDQQKLLDAIRLQGFDPRPPAPPTPLPRSTPPAPPARVAG